jgi:hypothetical protein
VRQTRRRSCSARRVLSLSALAHWESAVLASIRGATGSIDERDTQITRSGMYAEYPAIFASYLELLASPVDAAIQLEALERAVFLAWYSLVELPVRSGLAELPESSIRGAMQELDTVIRSGRGDDELRAMLAWYHDRFSDPFELFGPVRSLEAFIAGVSPEDALRLMAPASLDGRGQLGDYWRRIVSASET